MNITKYLSQAGYVNSQRLGRDPVDGGFDTTSTVVAGK